MIKLKLEDTFTDATLPVLLPDELMQGANGGVLSIYDYATSFCWPGGNPVNGSVINNIAVANSGSVVIPAGAITWAGNGMDFSGVTAINTYLAGNVATSAALKDGTEYWLVCVYMKLPTNADWLANGGLQSFCQWGGTAFPTGNQFIIIAFSTSGRAIDFRRQTAVSASENLQLTPAVADQGTLVQLACWRNASGFGARIKGVTSTVAPAPVASPSINSADFSGIEPRFGVIANSWGATPNTTRKFRIYRTWIENLRISGRTPATVLDADYSRTIARGVFT